MNFITQFGDLALLMPLSFLLVFSLWIYETKEAALAFVAPLTVCMFLMLLFKLFFLSCGENLIANVTSPSGHTAASTFVFGSIGIVMSTHAPRWGKIPILLVISALVIAIGISRVYVGAHSPSEVAIAFFVGVISLLFFTVTYSRLIHPKINFWMLLLAVVALIALLFGFQSHAETFIREWSFLIRNHSSACSVMGRISLPSGWWIFQLKK